MAPPPPDSLPPNDGQPSTERNPQEGLTIADQDDDATRPHYYLAHLETLDGQNWTSLHLTGETPSAN